MAKKPEDIVPVLYGSKVQYQRCPAFCRFHHCHLTKNQILKKGCLGKQCKALDKILSNPFWEEREQKKMLKKGGNKND